MVPLALHAAACWEVGRDGGTDGRREGGRDGWREGGGALELVQGSWYSGGGSVRQQAREHRGQARCCSC